MQLPEMNEATAAPGTPLNPYSITYGRAAIDQYLARSGEPSEPYFRGETLTVPPGMFLGAYGRLIHGTFHYEAGVHTASHMFVTRCPDAGEEVTVSGEIKRTFERNGDKYVVFDVIIKDLNGTTCASVEHTSIYGLRSRA